jgi:hypothetical protein
MGAVLTRLRRRAFRRGSLSVRFTAMVAALLLTSGIVIRLSAAMSSLSPQARQELAGTSELILRDDAAGVPMFSQVVLQPGEPVVRCIGVSVLAASTPAPVRLGLSGATGDPALTSATRLTVERGHAEPGAGCDGFVARETVATGTLADLNGAAAAPVWSPAAGEARAVYRITAELTDASDELQGLAVGGLTFTWDSGVGVAARGELLQKALLLAASVAQNAILPLLLMLTFAILFLGVQDRIDRHDPKLAMTPPPGEPLTFEPVRAR